MITLVVFGSLPFVFKQPWLGAMMWIWISVMSPHTQGWGFARDFPFGYLIAITIVLAIVFSKRRYPVPRSPLMAVFFAFVAWMCFASLFAIHPDQVGPQLFKVLKIMGMTVVVAMLVRSRRHIEWMIWTIVISIGYYGVKGGIFTLRSGGQYRVWGPSGTFIDGNNEMALALIVIIPLMYYLSSRIQQRWGKRAMLACLALCALASMASYSRGAVVAMVAMLLFLWLKSHNKGVMGMLIVCLVPVAMLLMPEQWYARVDTINTYQTDESAQGRLNAWAMAYNLANDRPMGGGFAIYDSEVFARYAPIPDDVHAAHSIYFQVLGEHGWVGLGLYLLMGMMTWRSGAWTVRHAQRDPELAWAVNMARMIQVSLLGFAVGGAFLSLAYFDVPYYLMVAMMALQHLVRRTERERRKAGAGLVTVPEDHTAGSHEPA
ncbi:putative O-glycosylation ligase, exosortase A system-associated [Rugamonas sp.]|uniref:putative O-glycosylation ligase, exosortase A system-associated n=1 Tax=Rugamonas sp. TaxID=1926287 RepID=UPI0025F17C4A|nr:putative O-glycosylation ligase, exosortase A system-associated [Rugamonas sp.]